MCSTWKKQNKLWAGWKSLPAMQEAVFPALPLPEEMQREWGELARKNLLRECDVRKTDDSMDRSPHSEKKRKKKAGKKIPSGEKQMIGEKSAQFHRD